MEYEQFLNQIITDGIKAATDSYKDKPNYLRGAIDGFEACRGKGPLELAKLHANAERECHEARAGSDQDYWRFRCFANEVEWVCNVVSAALVNQGGIPVLAHQPTARGMMMAAEILGVAPEGRAVTDIPPKTNTLVFAFDVRKLTNPQFHTFLERLFAAQMDLPLGLCKFDVFDQGVLQVGEQLDALHRETHGQNAGVHCVCPMCEHHRSAEEINRNAH